MSSCCSCSLDPRVPYTLFADYKARIEIVYVEPPMPVILAQNKRREWSVPERVIRELADKCEPPTWAEAHDLVLYEPANH